MILGFVESLRAQHVLIDRIVMRTWSDIDLMNYNISIDQLN